MKFLEKDLEEIIYLSDRDKLSDKGLTDYGKFYRQLRIGNYGVSDIISISKPYYHSGFKTKMKGIITIYELKKDKVSVSSFFQALGYLKGIITYLEKRNKDHLFNYEICLIGKEIDLDSTICYLPSIFNFDISENDIDLQSKTSVKIYTYNYTIDGLEFNSCEDYNLINKGF
jgi:hypothetical protein